MIYRYILTKDGMTLINDLPEKCQACAMSCKQASVVIQCKGNGKTRRQGIAENEYGIVYICSDDQDDINSSRIFKDKIQAHLSILPTLINIRLKTADEEKKVTKRLIHNLTTLNAHCIQEIYSHVSQEKLAERFPKDSYQLVEKSILEKPKEAAKLFFRILKNNYHMKAEFSVFNKLYEVNPKLNFQQHEIRKVILNVLHTFFSDFIDKNIAMEVAESRLKVDLDYDSVTVALVHLFDNAAKYCLKDSVLKISFGETQKEYFFKIEMTSVQVRADETEKIFAEGYSGHFARNINLAGKGIGLALAKQLFALNNATLELIPAPGENRITKWADTPFCPNEILVKFSKKK